MQLAAPRVLDATYPIAHLSGCASRNIAALFILTIGLLQEMFSAVSIQRVGISCCFDPAYIYNGNV